jgi:hypothetical protein
MLLGDAYNADTARYVGFAIWSDPIPCHMLNDHQHDHISILRCEQRRSVVRRWLVAGPIISNPVRTRTPGVLLSGDEA